MNDTDETKARATGEGEYDSKNEKSGMWIEYSKYQEVGYYIEGKRSGIWIILNDDQQIGEGEYDENNLQTGQWIEYVNDNIEVGLYDKGKRIGIWEVFKSGNKIGSGRYNENKKKTGKWIEFQESEQKVLNMEQGRYSNGIRTGKWQILCDGEIIGEGEYDEDRKKTGKWVENCSKQAINISDSETGLCFSQKIQYYKKVGQYEKGYRKGVWWIFRDEQQIGEGEFDQNDQKTGIWIEVNEDIEIGEYYQGKRKGVWKVLRNEQIIGEGEFDDENRRIGQWKVKEGIEIKEKILLLFDSIITLNITYIGEYRNGEQYGLWKAYDEQGKRIQNADLSY